MAKNICIYSLSVRIHIKCDDSVQDIQCEERISDYGVKYVWRIRKEGKGDPSYGARIATGKYILAINFAEKANYEKRKVEYQKLLSSLNAIATDTTNSNDINTNQSANTSKDEHGRDAAEGLLWCVTKKKCLRP